MVQGNISLSKATVLRGLHFHRAQADWWNFYTGAAVVGLYDLRAGSPTEGVGLAIPLDADRRPRTVCTSRRAWRTASTPRRDVMLHYMVDNYYTGADEFGIAWDDPGLGIDWSATDPILSERDRTNPSLEEVLRDPPPFG